MSCLPTLLHPLPQGLKLSMSCLCTACPALQVWWYRPGVHLDAMPFLGMFATLWQPLLCRCTTCPACPAGWWYRPGVHQELVEALAGSTRQASNHRYIDVTDNLQHCCMPTARLASALPDTHSRTLPACAQVTPQCNKLHMRPAIVQDLPIPSRGERVLRCGIG